jgi:hypothetical protein
MSARLSALRLPTLETPKRNLHKALLRDADENRDLLLVQSRDPPRHERRIRFGLRVLGLSGAGTARELASSNPAVRRLISSTRQFVHLVPLAISAVPEKADAFCMSKDATVNRELYPVEDHTALQFDVGHDERLNIEPYEDHFSLAWTTALSIGPLVGRLQEFLPGAAHVTCIVSSSDDEDSSFSGSREEVVSRLSAQTKSLEFWRLDFSDRAYTWERDHTSGDLVDRGLMGFIGVVFSMPELSRLISATATPAIGACVSQLLPQGAEAVNAARTHRHAVS